MRKTFLVVEDYDDSRDMLKFVLEDKGYRVVEAKDGLEAIECVEKYSPDLILMDVSLPKMAGLEATKEIRKLANAEHIPIICVTAHSGDVPKKAIEVGCKEVVAKPIDIGKLPDIIARYLNG